MFVNIIIFSTKWNYAFIFFKARTKIYIFSIYEMYNKKNIKIKI